jgi:hypothetical protein
MAATDAGRPVRNAAYRHIFTLRSTSGAAVSAATSLDSEYSQQGGSFSDCTNEATEISGGVYYLDLTATEMASTSTGLKVTSAEAVTYFCEIVPEKSLHSGVVQSAGASSLTLATTASAVDDTYNGAYVEIVRYTGAGQIRTITDYTGSTKVATLDRAWATSPDNTSVYVVHPAPGVPSSVPGYVDADMKAIAADTDAATFLSALYTGAVISGSISDASPTTTDFDGDSSLSSVDDFYNSMILVFTSGDLEGYVVRISDYTGSSKNIALASTLPATPGNGDTFCILAKVF